MMLFNLLIFLAGLGILYLGAEWLVKGAASLALHYGIRPMIVGITVVALGTSMPEFVVNFFAALSGQDGIAVGNIIGSNISNIGLILGVSSLVIPLTVGRSTLRREYPMMMACMVLFYVLALDGMITYVDGLVLIGGLVAFFSWVIFDSRRHAARRVVTEVDEDALEVFEGPDEPDEDDRDEKAESYRKALNLLAGIVFLAAGARLMVYAAVDVANQLGIDPVVVGLTIVAVGTSLPELAASIVSAMRKEDDLSVGNILGSNLLNVLFVVGLVALIRPIRVETAAIDLHFPVMLGFGVLLLPLAWTQYRITRMEGGVLVLGFVGYLLYLTVPYL